MKEEEKTKREGEKRKTKINKLEKEKRKTKINKLEKELNEEIKNYKILKRKIENSENKKGKSHS